MIKEYGIECELATNEKSFFIPAGNIYSSDYWKKLSSIDWNSLLFEENNGLAFLLI
jgi:hypothetical protein